MTHTVKFSMPTEDSDAIEAQLPQLQKLFGNDFSFDAAFEMIDDPTTEYAEGLNLWSFKTATITVSNFNHLWTLAKLIERQSPKNEQP